MKYKPISEEVELIAKKIVDVAYTVHKILGPGLLEKVYEVCFCHEMNPVWEAQLLSYLKLTGKRLGFIINFNVPLIKDGIKRIIL